MRASAPVNKPEPRGLGQSVLKGLGNPGSGASFGVAVVAMGLMTIGVTAAVGAGAGAGIAALAEGDVKKGMKWGAGIGAGLGLLGWLPIAALGAAAASESNQP